jgi:hypothetical protein
MLTRCRTLQQQRSVVVTAMRRGKRPRTDSGGSCHGTFYWYRRAFGLLPEPPISNQRSFQLGATTASCARSNLDSKIGENSLTAKSTTTIWYRLDFVDQHGRACEKGPRNMDYSTVWSLSLESPNDFVVEDIKQAIKLAWRQRAMDETNANRDTAHNALAGISVAWMQVLAAPPHSPRKDKSKRTTSIITSAVVSPLSGGGSAARPLLRRLARETVPARPLDPGAVWSPIHHGGGEPTCPLTLRVTLPMGKFACKTTVTRVSIIVIGIANHQCRYLCRDDQSTRRAFCNSVDQS